MSGHIIEWFCRYLPPIESIETNKKNIFILGHHMSLLPHCPIMLIDDLENLRDGIRPLDLDELRAAIRGQSVPQNFLHELAYKCLVAGIRHHDGFALGVRGKSLHQSIERAFNARDIMSGRVPEMEKPEDIPYCFWYPDVPNQDALRQLLKDHPTTLMRYQVGRACAVGGYVELFKELDVLPDVSIAEEARDNLPASKAIYELVMNAPILYRVMDDYNLCLFDKPQSGACLNGDTCVRSTLNKRQPLCYEIFPPPFDITEDWCLGADVKRLEERAIPSDTLSLLYAPLPRHLPSVDKDILILMAAFTGNIDRYARLRRERTINGEMQCIVRGIYHDTLFARWCYEQPELAVLRKFVHARFIMNDDLTWFDYNQPVSKDDLPRIIWYPQQANPTTYMELFRLMPELKQLVAQALVACDEPRDFLRLEPELTEEIYGEITNGVHSDLFREFIDKRVSYEEEGELAEWTELPHDVHDVAPYDHLISKEMKPHFSHGLKELTLDDVGFENREVYEPDTRDARDLIRYMSAFPKQPRDHYREEREAIMREITGRMRQDSGIETLQADS